MSDPLKGRVFTQEEVNAILSRAVERQNPSGGGLTYAELIDTARQAGIDPGAIDAAVQDLGEQRETDIADERVRGEIARRRWHSWRAFSVHFTVFVMFSVLIAFINIHELNQNPRGDLFFPIPILAWGIGIAAHFMAIFFPTVFPNPARFESVRRELERRDERSRRREKKVERRVQRTVEKEELKESAKELGVAVQRGMATILSDVAKTIHEEVDRANRTSGKPQVRVAPRARVGEDPPEDEDGDESAGKRQRRR